MKRVALICGVVAAALALAGCRLEANPEAGAGGSAPAGVTEPGASPNGNISQPADPAQGAEKPGGDSGGGTGRQVRFGDKLVDAEGLSEETLEWLDWYNGLPEEERLRISAVPSDLLEESGLVTTEDAKVPAEG